MSFALRNGRRPWTCLPAAAAACALSFALSGPLRAGEPGGEPGPGPRARGEMMERGAPGLRAHGHRGAGKHGGRYGPGPPPGGPAGGGPPFHSLPAAPPSRRVSP